MLDFLYIIGRAVTPLTKRIQYYNGTSLPFDHHRKS